MFKSYEESLVFVYSGFPMCDPTDVTHRAHTNFKYEVADVDKWIPIDFVRVTFVFMKYHYSYPWKHSMIYSVRLNNTLMAPFTPCELQSTEYNSVEGRMNLSKAGWICRRRDESVEAGEITMINHYLKDNILPGPNMVRHSNYTWPHQICTDYLDEIPWVHW